MGAPLATALQTCVLLGVLVALGYVYETYDLLRAGGWRRAWTHLTFERVWVRRVYARVVTEGILTLGDPVRVVPA